VIRGVAQDTTQAGTSSAGEVKLLCAQGDRIAGQWASTTEVVTGKRLTLVVA
jgi:hypothetical protein